MKKLVIHDRHNLLDSVLYEKKTMTVAAYGIERNDDGSAHLICNVISLQV